MPFEQSISKEKKTEQQLIQEAEVFNRELANILDAMTETNTPEKSAELEQQFLDVKGKLDDYSQELEKVWAENKRGSKE